MRYALALAASLVLLPACAAPRAGTLEDRSGVITAAARPDVPDRAFLSAETPPQACHVDGDCPAGSLCHPGAGLCFAGHPLPRMLDVSYVYEDASGTAGPCALVPIYFAFDDARLVREAGRWLDHDKRCLDARQPRRVVVTGYADARGDRTYNVTLSRRRGEVVRGFLKEKGLDAQVEVVAMGAEDPLRRGDTEHDYAYNRRVEIEVK
jgi:hypothetical protein